MLWMSSPLLSHDVSKSPFLVSAVTASAVTLQGVEAPAGTFMETRDFRALLGRPSNPVLVFGWLLHKGTLNPKP